MSHNRKGYRGYIGARMGLERSAPQHIQQLVMRDYCQRNGLAFLLSAVEYRMKFCTMILDAVLDELDHLEGIVMYSIALFPEKKEKRMAMYRRVIDQGCALHTAVEAYVVRNWDDAKRLEDIFLVQEALTAAHSTTLESLKQWDRQHAGT